MRLILLFLILVICVSSAYAINTNISFSPSTPNGNNGWFVIEPIITLTGNSSGITYFRFGNNTLAISILLSSSDPDPKAIDKKRSLSFGWILR